MRSSCRPGLPSLLARDAFVLRQTSAVLRSLEIHQAILILKPGLSVPGGDKTPRGGPGLAPCPPSRSQVKTRTTKTNKTLLPAPPLNFLETSSASCNMPVLESRSLQGIPGSPEKSQKEGEEDQDEVREPGGPPRSFTSPGPPCLLSGSCLGSLELPQGVYFKEIRVNKSGS